MYRAVFFDVHCCYYYTLNNKFNEGPITLIAYRINMFLIQYGFWEAALESKPVSFTSPSPCSQAFSYAAVASTMPFHD